MCDACIFDHLLSILIHCYLLFSFFTTASFFHFWCYHPKLFLCNIYVLRKINFSTNDFNDIQLGSTKKQERGVYIVIKEVNVQHKWMAMKIREQHYNSLILEIGTSYNSFFLKGKKKSLFKRSSHDYYILFSLKKKKKNYNFSYTHTISFCRYYIIIPFVSWSRSVYRHVFIQHRESHLKY